MKTIRCILFTAALFLLVFGTAVAGLAADVSSWDDLKASLEAGSDCVLTQDLKVSVNEPINISRPVTLELNGHKIRAVGPSGVPLFSVTAALTVKSQKDSGTVQLRGGSCVFDVQNGSLDLSRVYVSGLETDQLIHSTDSTITIAGSRMSGLTTGKVNGGGMCLMGTSSADVRATTFCRLQGQNGGAIYIAPDSTATLAESVRIENCHAMIAGGAICSDSETPSNLECTVIDCTSPSGDAGVVEKNELTPWQKLKAAVNAGKTYVMQEDIYGEETEDADFIMEAVGVDCGIDLNGHTLTIRNDSGLPVVSVPAQDSFYIYDRAGGGQILLNSTFYRKAP